MRGPDNIERRDYLAAEHEAWDNRGEIGDSPMTVISQDWMRRQVAAGSRITAAIAASSSKNWPMDVRTASSH
jgi:hypothetical protein